MATATETSLVPHKEYHKEGAGDYVKDIIYGGLDGIVSVFVSVAAVWGTGSVGLGAVLVLGVAKLFAGAFSMGVGDWLATEAEVDMAKRERKREEWECANLPEEEVNEMVELYRTRLGYDEPTARRIFTLLSKYPRAFVDIMMAEELEIPPGQEGAIPWKHGLATTISFTAFGVVPLATYVIVLAIRKGVSFPASVAFYISIGVTAATLLAMATMKARITGTNWLSSCIWTLVLGSLTAAIGWGTAFGLDKAFPGVNS